MGNHDHMIIGSVDGIMFEGDRMENIWMYNGGKATVASYSNGRISDAHIDYIRQMPRYIELDDVLLSHTGNGKDGVSDFEQLWERGLLAVCPKYRVFGHTYSKEAVVTDTCARIDTGCAYAHRGCGNLTAMHWPSKQLYSMTNIDL